jgi:hypothetical protein
MSGATSVYELIQSTAFAGMKVDSMDDNVDTCPCGGVNEIPFGRVCVFESANGRRVQLPVDPVPGPLAGITLHDHIIGAYGNVYRQYDAVSVLTRGRVWADVSVMAGSAASIAYGNDVAFELATGMVTGIVSAATGAVINAKFRSGVIAVPPIWPSATLGSGLIALVELHYPFAG